MGTLTLPFPPLKGTLVEGQVDKHRRLTVEGVVNQKAPHGVWGG